MQPTSDAHCKFDFNGRKEIRRLIVLIGYCLKCKPVTARRIQIDPFAHPVITPV